MASVLGLPIAAHGSIDSVGGRRASRFSRKVLPRMLGVVDHARPLRTSPLRCNGFCLRSPERPRHLGQSPFRGSVPGLRVPLSTLRARPLGRVHMTRGHRGWLALQCANPSFAALCRFIPALLQTESLRASPHCVCGRDAGCPAPPAQIPARGTTALGSCLRSEGKGVGSDKGARCGREGSMLGQGDACAATSRGLSGYAY